MCLAGASWGACHPFAPSFRLTLPPSRSVVRCAEAQWAAVHAAYRGRECGGGGTSAAAPCPVCREDFRTEQQVLLSCSHAYHRTCIRSWERFAQDRGCPICRTKFVRYPA